MRIPVTAMGLALTAIALPAHAAGSSGSSGSTSAAASEAPALPRLFQAAGYSQPDITPGLCEIVGPKETRCVIPEMTAGRYVIVAAGTSTATGEGAAQAIDIRLDNGGEEQVCAKAVTPKTAKPWTEGASTIRVACVVQIISDDKIIVRATYADSHATTVQKGPTLQFQRVHWSPVWSAVAAPVQVKAAQKPAGK